MEVDLGGIVSVLSPYSIGTPQTTYVRDLLVSNGTIVLEHIVIDSTRCVDNLL